MSETNIGVNTNTTNVILNERNISLKRNCIFNDCKEIQKNCFFKKNSQSIDIKDSNELEIEF